ncbi:hypothetical protein GTO89_06845 [Heliobacterium gestii]|uniref:VWA domain-containing protein n=1 Tax=Heliomicrobium gestii TaxID=2699 RepID=A0A845L7Q8_HELGE|nr:vWA domain-containing protein [Heliomicrobium gestii]MBM7866459.1 hypothetical protein [Heliomicrobium gestii]MZP42757.1 hypothetical protein [Heliomicrobium gestii]
MIKPSSLTATLEVGESIHEDKTVEIPRMPPKADILLSFDVSGSMEPILYLAKSYVLHLMMLLDRRGLGCDLQYGVISYSDYPGLYESEGYREFYGLQFDYPYRLDQPLTGNLSPVVTVMNNLYTGSSGDNPECYARPFYESYTDPAIGWRRGAKRILINIGDSVPHDRDVNRGVPGKSGVWLTGLDPGRDGVVRTADDLTFLDVIQGLVDHHITLVEFHRTAKYLDYWQYWTGLTGGKAYNISSISVVNSLEQELVDLLGVPVVANLRLEASEGFQRWLTRVTPAAYSGPSGVSTDFRITLRPPRGTKPGIYTFAIRAVDDRDIEYGAQEVTLTVTPSTRGFHPASLRDATA